MNAAVRKITDAQPIDDPVGGLAKLREPFPANQVSTLPKPYKKDSPKGRCTECGGYHGLPAVHLSYVGHAALTDRLLDVDPLWTWEPVAFTPDGLPAFDRSGGLWIRLTVCGVTRLGYGDADGKTGGNAVKEAIGDALRNAGMRFGAALDLWHKGDLHAEESEPTPSALEMAINMLRGCGNGMLFKGAWEHNIEGWKGVMSADELTKLRAVKDEMVAKFVREAAEDKAREAARAAPKSGASPAPAASAGDPFGDVPPLDVLEGDEIPFIRKWSVL